MVTCEAKGWSGGWKCEAPATKRLKSKDSKISVNFCEKHIPHPEQMTPSMVLEDI